MRYFREGLAQENTWSHLSDSDELTASGPVFVSQSRYLAEKEALRGLNNAIGVRVEPGDDVAEIAPHLNEINVIAINFPKYTDGRGYSSARLLRERFGFTGEIRACGNVLVDQVHFMLRCGIDGFEVENPHTIKALEAGDDKGVGFYYQPSALKEGQKGGARP